MTTINQMYAAQRSAAAVQNNLNFPTDQVTKSAPGAGPVAKNLSNYISPQQLNRLKHDVSMWRAGISEAEQAYFPQRIRMQRQYLDTVINGHVWACWEARRDLTLLRKFDICIGKNEPNDELTKLFKGQLWFTNFLTFALDAIAYGYSLISLGNVFNDAFPELTIVKRWHVSPDRLNVTNMLYSNIGANFNDEPYADWHVYIPTITENGQSPCGYGLFYRVGLYEILLRNVLTQNADFVEIYAQPYRVGKTSVTEGDQRDQLDQALKNIGSNGYAIIDPMDEITFLETQLGGTGWQSYDNLQQRCEKIVSKIILGHADALDSIPGKLGNDGEESPAQKAMSVKQAKDGDFIESVVNNLLFPKMRNIGFNIPIDAKFTYNTSHETQQQREQEDTNNLQTATVAKTMKEAGFTVKPEYITERTGIPVEATPEPVAPAPGKPGIDAVKKPDLSKSIKNKLDALYTK